MAGIKLGDILGTTEVATRMERYFNTTVVAQVITAIGVLLLAAASFRRK